MTFTAVVLVVAVAAGGRGLWSPCGLSMLSTITPIGEGGRGHRYGSTAAWYVAGAVLGGLCLGVAMGAAARFVGDRDGIARAGIVLVAAIVALASDGRVVGFALPIHRRQVNERWLDHYRSWVYGLGFGWQVGTGVATYITTAATYLLVVVGVVAVSPASAVLAGTTFGFVRGIAVFLTRDVRTSAALHRLHRRVQQLEPRSRHGVALVECVVALVAAATIAPWLLGVTAMVGAAAWCTSAARAHRPVTASIVDYGVR